MSGSFYPTQLALQEAASKASRCEADPDAFVTMDTPKSEKLPRSRRISYVFLAAMACWIVPLAVVIAVVTFVTR